MTAAWLPRMPRVVSSIALPPQPVPDRIKVLHVITNFTTGAGGNTLLSAMGMDTDRYEVFIEGANDAGPPPEGEGPACLEVALHDLEPVVTGEVGHPAGVPVDRRDPMAALEEEPGVAAATTGHVENRPSGRHQRGETGDPVGRRHRPEARPPNHRSHAGNIQATCRNMGPRS